MRVAILGIHHESNSFASSPTTLDDFKRYEWHEGDAIRPALGEGHHDVAGLWAAIDENSDWEAVPVFFTEAMTGGPIDRQTEAQLWTHLSQQLDHKGPIDAALIAVHGAAVGEDHPDFDGWWLSLLRERLGASVPMVAVLDSHANVTPNMASALNAVTTYRSNPHVDQREAGYRAGQLLGRIIREDVRPTVAYVALPMVLNIERQLTDTQPCRSWLEHGRRLESLPHVWAADLCLGYPYSDVAEMGVSVTIVADGLQADAHALAHEWAEAIWKDREHAKPNLISINEATKQIGPAGSTTGLLDMGDNVGAGSPGDLTALTHALRKAGALPLFVNLVDPAMLAETQRAGVGGQVRISVGGQHNPNETGGPLDIDGRVIALTDGRWTDPTPLPDGRVHYDEGPQAFVSDNQGVTIQISGLRVFPISLGQLTHAGLEPRQFRAIVIKGVHAPVAAYGPAVDRLIRVDSPGPTSANMLDWPYQHRRRPLFPFEANAKL